MKQFVLACMLSAGVISAQAQTASSGGAKAPAWEDKEESSVSNNTTVSNDPLSGMTMAMRNNVVTFVGIPADMALRASVTNQDGEVVKSKKISPESSTMEVGGLPKGMYFITLFHKSKSMKGFVIHI